MTSFFRSKSRKGLAAGLAGAALLLLAGLFASGRDAAAAINVSAGDAWMVHEAQNGSGNYRYGASSIINADGSIDAFFASPGNGTTEWDWIRYKRSTDGGHTWGPETTPILPTPGGLDSHSNCDPGIIKFGGYYYLAYTGVDNPEGIRNQVFVARATSPGGPYQKWNGTGWGGSPAPLIPFTGAVDRWGAAEPSFLVMGTDLYIYYTWVDRKPDGTPFGEIRLSKASTTNPNWPASVTYVGALPTGVYDVKYIDAFSKFFAVRQIDGFGTEGRVMFMESTDGLNFYPSNFPRGKINGYLNNPGLSGDESGHIDLADANYVNYAAGSSWGRWNNNWNNITLTDDNLSAVPQIARIYPGNGSVKIYFDPVPGTTFTIKYGTASGSYTSTVSGVTGSPYTLSGLTNGTKYYFVMTATNGNGTSGNSVQLSATPLDYTASPRISAAASSTTAGWTPNAVIDGNPASAWTSVGRVSGAPRPPMTLAAVEWISVDTGSARFMKRVVATPRQPGEWGYPTLTVQTSVDGTTWSNAPNTYFRQQDGITTHVYEFEKPIYARYVRLYATVLPAFAYPQMTYYFQLGELDIQHVTYGATASSFIASREAGRAIDGDPASFWTSTGSASPVSTQWLALDTGAQGAITGLTVAPRGMCFPVDFKIQTSADGTTWTDVPGQSYTAFPNPGTALTEFKFGSPVTARYVRMYATKLSADQFNNFYFQVAEIKVDGDVKLASHLASSDVAGWRKEGVVDLSVTTGWSSVGHTAPGATEWVSVDMGAAKPVNKVLVVPRPLYAFPKDFEIQTSTDGVNWTLVPGQRFTDYYANSFAADAYRPHVFQFNAPVTARYVRLIATKLRADQFNNYYFQLMDFRVEQ